MLIALFFFFFSFFFSGRLHACEIRFCALLDLRSMMPHYFDARESPLPPSIACCNYAASKKRKEKERKDLVEQSRAMVQRTSLV